MIFRFSAMLAICLVSRPYESPKPGVSITIKGYSFSSLEGYVTKPVTLSVSDFRPGDDLKNSSPIIELAVVDFPCPVTPIRHIDLNTAASYCASLQFLINKSTKGSLIYNI